MIHVGTSGYNYPEWKGSFYPSALPQSKMLSYYAERLSTVEINYSFYRLPSGKVLQDWSQTVPDGFTFTLKAPRRITHELRLKAESKELVETFCSRAGILGPKLGVLLFQLPPTLRKDLGRLEAFLQWVPEGTRTALEFRHASWHSDDVFSALRNKNAALCIADSETMTTPVVSTADYAYFRLRDEGYQTADIQRWADVISPHANEWKETFVYFKHEEAGKGPQFAKELLNVLGLNTAAG